MRHYYLRQGPRFAEVRVNLVDKKRREYQSHALTLRIRSDLQAVALRHGANIKIVEVPPGPPVIATIVAEIHGSLGEPYEQITESAKIVRHLMEGTPGIVDVDDTLVAPQQKITFKIDRAKAALNGISGQQIAEALQGTVLGASPSSLRVDNEVHPVNIQLRLPREGRALQADLKQVMISGSNGERVFLAELGTFADETIDQPIYHKNLNPVVYVFGETAGIPPPDAVLTLAGKVEHSPELKGVNVIWSGERMGHHAPGFPRPRHSVRNSGPGDLRPAAVPDPELSPSGHPTHRPAPLGNRHPAWFLAP
ncbi:Acriflavin resistance protein (fragment) [Syntrophobacter sp. SbD2]